LHHNRERGAQEDIVTIWDQVGREIEAFIEDIRELPVSSPVRAVDLRRELESRFDDFTTPIPLADLTSQVADLFRRHSVHVTHPRYFGLFNPSVSRASIVADTLVALYNPQLAAWSHSPIANEIERFTLRHLARALGFDADATAATFTTGGLEANLSAVLAALAHRFPQYDRLGIAGLEAAPSVYVTSESHHSFVKICRMAGLGTDALREVPTTATFAMDVAALGDLMAADRRTGRVPLVIVGTAGSTAGGIVDPLETLADIARDTGTWFHVDAAWGGAAVLVPRLRPYLAGIERADSVTWDAHKWLSVPMGAGMFFCRHVDANRRAFDVSASYMPSQSSADTIDPYVSTLQWTRRAIGLKLFMSIAARGRDAFNEQIDHQARLGDDLRATLRASGWLVVNETALPVVCVSSDEIRAGRVSTTAMVEMIQRRGRVWVSEVVLGRRERALRACITSFRSSAQDLDVLVDELARARRAQVERQ
jgi:aromatic-L-amino-acid/L-tryptophan decarboxylase